jgi:nondiscriminating glutamyl-tRNA synthetase
MSGDNVRVRFAPSPTGSLHVGNAKTALVNWLFATKHNGTFILRIEDTDRERSTPEALDTIYRALRWLGMDWDEGPEVGGPHEPYFQMQRTDLYLQNARRLIESGHAYRCFCTKEELDLERERARHEKRAYRYGGKCRAISLEESETRRDQAHVIRLKVPAGETSFNDVVFGRNVVSNKEIGDFIIMKSDGTPTYHFAVVVDDVEMEITHIIRGEGHLSNTPKHVLLYDAFGHEMPVFCHLPMILGPDGKKLSKRHGATDVLQFKNDGFLDDTMINYLSLLGWASGSDQEVFSVDEIVQQFELDQIGKSACVFNYKKLQWLNGQHIRRLPQEEFKRRIVGVLVDNGLISEQDARERDDWMTRLAAACQEKIGSLNEIVGYSDFFFQPVESYEEKGIKKHWKIPEVVEILSEFRDGLAGLEPFDIEQLETLAQAITERREIGLGKLIHPARLALTGKTIGPGFFETAALLGRDECVSRLDKSIQYTLKLHKETK